MCRLVSGRDPSSRGRGATGSKAWTASAIISSAFAGHGAGWWWKTPSWCTWTETKAGSTLCCCLTQSSKWKWAVPTQTPNMESASRTSLGRSADVCLCTDGSSVLRIYAWRYIVIVMHAWPVCCSFRNLIIKCSSYRQAHWWSHEINQLADTCDFLKEQRFEGFAPPRENMLTKWSDTEPAWDLQLSIFRFHSHLLNLFASRLLFEGMWMEVATLQTWLMLSNKPRRKFSSRIGGKCNLW